MSLGLVLVARLAAAQPPKPAKPSEGDDLRREEAAQRACAAHEPSCNWLETYSSLERSSLGRALAARGYQIDPAPWGRVIGKIHIYNEDVFAEHNWLQFFNFVHYTTRERAIRDELTFGEGQPWNDELVAETARNLRDPLYSSVVAIVPVKSAEPGKVDVLVVTRDVWSLRFNTNYQFQQGSLTNLRIALSENNFLGNRDLASAQLTMDQGAIGVGPVFIDKNVVGSHLYLSVSADQRITRQSLDVFDPTFPRVSLPSGDPGGLEDAGLWRREGSDSSISLSKQLWSLASKWGWGVSFGHDYGVTRNFLFTGLRGVHVTNSAGRRLLLPWEFEQHNLNENANVVRQWGTEVKQQLTLGQAVSSVRPFLLPGFSTDPAIQESFIRQTFPRSERLSAVYLEYYLFLPRYRTLRNVNTYDLAEDFRMGPSLDIQLSQGLRFLGSEAHYTSPTVSVGWAAPWGDDGYVSMSGGLFMRLQHARLADGREVGAIDSTASASVRAVTSELRYFRVVGEASIATRWHDTQNNFLSIGSDSGLRGYGISQFIGQRRLSGIVEARSLPLAWWVLRMGAVAFYEVGGAADSFAGMPLYQDVGLGVRVLVPQTSRDTFRFDVALPLVSARDWPAGHPQFQAGFAAYF